MSSLTQDLTIFNRFNFERQPVGIKYLYHKPKGIERLSKDMAVCEMLIEAQTGNPFYADQANYTCAETIFSGEEHDAVFRAGGLGFHGGYDPRAGIRFKNLYVPKMPKGIIKYVVFSPFDKISFNPDVLVITCDVSQAEILLRASTYKSGKPWSNRISLYLQCAWLLVYPYLSGELNYTITGISYGMKWRRTLPEGLMIISIPFDLLPTMIQNLGEMEWNLPAYTMDKEDYVKWFNSQVELAKQKSDVDL